MQTYRISFVGTLILIILSLISCNDQSSTSMVQPAAINDIHVNVLSWKNGLTKNDGLYYYNGQVYNGTIDNRSLGRKIFSQVIIKDGKIHGDFIEKYDNGVKRTLMKYVDGLKDGVQKGWHKSGQLSYQYIAKDGHLTGDYKEYYPNGNIQIESMYELGQEVKKKIYTSEGKVIANYHIKNGKYYGLLGSSSCIGVFQQDAYSESYEK